MSTAYWAMVGAPRVVSGCLHRPVERTRPNRQPAADENGAEARGRTAGMAQYAVLIYTTDSAHPAEKDDRHAQELAESGSMLAAYALTPRDLARSIRATGVTDGPFIEAKEIVAGVYVLDAP